MTVKEQDKSVPINAASGIG